MLYDSEGTLLQRKYIKNGTTISKRDYLSGVEVVNDAMESVFHKDGRIVFDNGVLKYEYYLKDHLGNVRTVLSDDDGNGVISTNEIKQRNDYYAFGLAHTNSAYVNAGGAKSNKYKYGGKEAMPEMALGMLDFGARLLDPAIGRWNGVDRLASEYSSHNGYAFVLNNPILLSDPDGMRVDSSYTVDVKTGVVATVDDKGGTETDYITYYYGNLGESDSWSHTERREVGHVYTNFSGEPASTTKMPGYFVHNSGLKATGGMETVDDPFTGGIQKATFSGAGALVIGLLRTSSKKTNPSVVYAIMKEGRFYKFGVSGNNLKRFNESLTEAGAGASGRVISGIVPKWNAHILEKYYTSLHFSKYGIMPTAQKIPFPIDLITGKKIKP